MFNFVLRVFSPFKIIFPFYSNITHYMKNKNQSRNVTAKVLWILLIPRLFQIAKKESSCSAQHHESFQATWNNPLCLFSLHREVSGSAVSPVEGGGDPARVLPGTPAALGPCCWSQLSCRSLTAVPQNNWIVPVPAPQDGQCLGWQTSFSFRILFLPQGNDSCPQWVTPAQYQHIAGGTGNSPPSWQHLEKRVRKRARKNNDNVGLITGYEWTYYYLPQKLNNHRRCDKPSVKILRINLRSWSNFFWPY